jgi:hydrogenase maturation protein HypF
MLFLNQRPPAIEPSKTMDPERAKIVVRGAVQGVGFRPFVYRLATELCLTGWVLNSAQGVLAEVEGPPHTLRRFLERLEKEKPALAIIQSREISFLDPVGYNGFEIRESAEAGHKTALILPDVATCSDCLREVFDSGDRRYRYPFTNCTNCGPRFSIIESLPYDRPNTSMKDFLMCADCTKEYHDPANRRFHAQPIACPVCGPRLELWNERGEVIAREDEALRAAAKLVADGKILALKGIGGFQLMADATAEFAVERLRQRKRREEKPFALMYPSLERIEQDCRVSPLERSLLLSPEAPIVLLDRRSRGSHLASSVAPVSANFGIMLPYTPLHSLLMREIGFPVVATSGNLASEPICVDEQEALKRLEGVADFYLVHNRPIARHVDDSIVRVIQGREMVLRRARGYAPLPVRMSAPLPCILAVGAHLKNSVALSVGQDVFVSQHIGDLETSGALSAFQKTVSDLPRLYSATPVRVACDLHPDYLSSQHALQIQAPLKRIQHHWAHVLSCMAEHDLSGPALGVSWDGAGYGEDGTIWGGEFLLTREESFERVAHLRQFRLPGGEAAVREPRRTALAILYEIWGENAMSDRGLAPVTAFLDRELRVIRQMLFRGLNAPVTSSAGRLFDAVASILAIRQRSTFEGQAAMELESAIDPKVSEFYPFKIVEGRPMIIDWAPTIAEILIDLRDGESLGTIAAKFHNTLVEWIVSIAQAIEEPRIVLTGGCFQNRYLLERSILRLSEAGFRPYWHQRVPTNDGGISLGQLVAAAQAIRATANKESEFPVHGATSEPLAMNHKP